MKPPPVAGVIERRLLVNYRADPEVVAALLPEGLRPQLVEGWSVAGICLLRLSGLRPRPLPAVLGVRSENAAHRIAVEWDTTDGAATGVYVPRRDSDSCLNVAVGGRLFPGVHHRARFTVAETASTVRIDYRAADGSAAVKVAARVTPTLEGSRLFAGLEAASAFFQAGSVGVSPGHDGRLEGMELRTDHWSLEAAALESVESSFFDDQLRFPPGTAEPDCALLMRRVPVVWAAA